MKTLAFQLVSSAKMPLRMATSATLPEVSLCSEAPGVEHLDAVASKQALAINTSQTCLVSWTGWVDFAAYQDDSGHCSLLLLLLSALFRMQARTLLHDPQPPGNSGKFGASRISSMNQYPWERLSLLVPSHVQVVLPAGVSLARPIPSLVNAITCQFPDSPVTIVPDGFVTDRVKLGALL